MLGASFPLVPLSSGSVATPTGLYKNGYLYRLRRIITAQRHEQPTGAKAWVVYRATGAHLESVANGGHVVAGTFTDHRFENGSGVVQEHELESSDDATGDIVARIALTGFREGVDFVLLHYYGKADLTAAESNPTAAWSGFLQSNNMATGLDMSGNDRHFELTGVSATTLLGSDAGDFA